MCCRRRACNAELIAESAVAQWASLVRKSLRRQRLRRLFAALGGFLRAGKEAGKADWPMPVLNAERLHQLP